MKSLLTIAMALCWLPLSLLADEKEVVNEAPQFEVKGVVVDENGGPLPGASVWVKGTVVGFLEG